MKLESLLKPFKIADEQILRRYTKLTTKWEDRGHSRYSLALFLDITSSLSMLFVAGPKYITYPYLFFMGVSIRDSHEGLRKGRHDGISENGTSFTISNPIDYGFNKFSKIIRMPELITGFSFAGRGIFDIYNSFANNEPTLSEGMENLFLGTSFILNSSSFYIKDSDPKLLDRAPFWKTAYEKIKEKIGSLIPQPNPEPVPSPALSLNNYLP